MNLHEAPRRGVHGRWVCDRRDGIGHERDPTGRGGARRSWPDGRAGEARRVIGHGTSSDRVVLAALREHLTTERAPGQHGGVPRRVRAGLAALVLVAGAPVSAAGSGPTTTDPAARKTQVDRERNRLAEQYDETLAAEADLVAAYEQSRATADELTRQVAVLDDYSAAVQRELDAATVAAAAGAAPARRLRGGPADRHDRASRRRGDLRATAVSGYVWFGERGTVSSSYGQAVVADEQIMSGFYAGYLNDVQDARVDAVEQQEARVSGLYDEAQRGQRSGRGRAPGSGPASRRPAEGPRRAGGGEGRRRCRGRAPAAAGGRGGGEAEPSIEQRLRSLQEESARLGELLRARQAAAAAQPAGASPPAGRPTQPAPAPSEAQARSGAALPRASRRPGARARRTRHSPTPPTTPAPGRHRPSPSS